MGGKETFFFVKHELEIKIVCFEQFLKNFAEAKKIEKDGSDNIYLVIFNFSS